MSVAISKENQTTFTSNLVKNFNNPYYIYIEMNKIDWLVTLQLT